MLLLSPVIVEIDTREARAELRWFGIGAVKIWFEEDWWLSFSILFYRKTKRFSELNLKSKKTKGERVKKRKRKIKPRRLLKKMIRLIRTFKIVDWEVAIDTGDFARNAQLYPLNFIPFSHNNLYINFMDQNYLVLRVSNRPWKMLFAFLV